MQICLCVCTYSIQINHSTNLDCILHGTQFFKFHKCINSITHLYRRKKKKKIKSTHHIICLKNYAPFLCTMSISTNHIPSKFDTILFDRSKSLHLSLKPINFHIWWQIVYENGILLSCKERISNIPVMLSDS